MNMHAIDLTPTQRKAIDRSRSFRETIAAKAAELADRKTRIALAALPVAALEAPLIRTPEAQVVTPDTEILPSGPNWFVVLAAEPGPQYPSIRDIQKAVCKHYDVKMVDLLSPRRTADIVKPRQVAMYLAKELTPHSLPQLGRRFGGRDHTTVLHAVRKIPADSRADLALAHDLSVLFQTITGAQQ